MLDTWLIYTLFACVLGVPLALYLRRHTHREKKVKEAIAKGELFTDTPRMQHPHIDVTNCIGCQSCTAACPEGHVIGMLGGKAAVIHPHKCIGHNLCAEACPVGAITLVRAHAGSSSDLPFLTPEYESSVPNLFIAGELGGLALIKNAVNQGRECIDTLARRLEGPNDTTQPDVYDVLIVGAGPAGISASLRAIEKKLRYVTIERDTIGGSVSKYPRQKMVMTSPVEFPLGGTLRKMQLSKEKLLSFWKDLCGRDDFNVRLNETVEAIQHNPESSLFQVRTSGAEYTARAVLLAMGRAGTPRKLGVKGEDLPKVMYRLLEADHYTGKNILVVGGGDSAVEAAIGLALQKGNKVTLSYRKSGFHRIKERNAQRLSTSLRSGRLQVIFDSMPVEFKEHTVLLEVKGAINEMPNDYVWIFAGGLAPNQFLRDSGVAFGPRDLTVEVLQETAAAV